MSVNTSAKFNLDTLIGLLPAGSLTILGVAETATAKTLSHTVATDAAIQTAVTTAAGQFVDRAANLATLQQKAQTALTTNATFQAITSPTTAQNSAQIQALTKQSNGVIRMLLDALDSTAGT